MARARRPQPPMSRRPRTTPRSGRRTAYPPPAVGPHLRTRRPAGAQLAARHLPHRLYRGRLGRPGPGASRHAGAGPGHGRSRPQPLAPAAPGPHRSPVRHHGGVLRPLGRGRPVHDVRHRLRTGLRGRRPRGAGSAGARPPLETGAPAGCGTGRRVRQLAGQRGLPDRLPLHPPAGVVADGPGPYPRPAGWPRPAHRLGGVRPGRARDVRTQRRRPVGRARGADVPRLGPYGRAAPAHQGGSRLPRHHALPARTAARAPRTAHDRRAAGGRWLDRAAGRHGRAVRRPRGRRERVPRGQAARGDGRHASRAAQPAVAARHPWRADRSRAARHRAGLLHHRAGGAAPAGRLGGGHRRGRPVRRAVRGTRALPGGRPAGGAYTDGEPAPATPPPRPAGAAPPTGLPAATDAAYEDELTPGKDSQ